MAMNEETKKYLEKQVKEFKESARQLKSLQIYTSRLGIMIKDYIEVHKIKDIRELGGEFTDLDLGLLEELSEGGVGEDECTW